MGYIYHIYSKDEPNTMYIGQASKNETHEIKISENKTGESVAGNRVLQHFSGLYDNHHENEEFMSWLKRNRLEYVVIEIYDDTNNYGIGLKTFRKFFNIWNPQNQPVQTNFQWILTNNKADLNNKFTKKEREYLGQTLLDAAEILHIYYYKKKGRQLLNHQMGGSTYWISNSATGKRILNREMTVDDLVNMINTDPMVVEQLQKTFTHTWKLYWGSDKIKKEFKSKLRPLFVNCLVKANGDRKKFQKEVSSKETEQKIFNYVGEMIWEHLPTIQNSLQHQVEGYTVEINELTKGLYSTKESFKKLANHYNIVYMLTNTLKSKKTVKAFEEFIGVKKGSKTIEKAISDAILSAFDEVVNNLSEMIENFNISLSNFFKITSKGKSDLPLNDLLNKDSYKILKCNTQASENYAKSLKHISYSYFSKIANEVLASNKISFTGLVYDLNGEYYGRVASHPSVSFKIEEALKTKAEIFQNDEEFTYNYVRQFLTIFTRYRGSPQLGNFSSLQNTKQTGWIGLFDLPLTKVGVMGSFALGNVYPAVPFSDRTGEEIKYWIDKAVSKAEYY